MSHSHWWQSAMRHCMGRLGLSPASFWAMTLPELLAIASGETAADSRSAPPRHDLEALMRRFPDNPDY